MAAKRSNLSTFVRVSLAVVVSAVVISLSWLNSSQITHLTWRVFTPDTSRCVVYDKPPRTGSTTIAGALRPCFRKKGYKSLPPGPPSTWYTYMQRFLEMDAHQRAAVGSHMFVTAPEMQKLRRDCSTLLYISSTRPVAERVLSVIKYETFPGHGKRNITSSLISRILRGISEEDLQKREYSLEHYPYLRQQHVRFLPENKVPEHDRIEPDYVVRDTHFQHDLEAILDALGCPYPSEYHANEHTLVRQRGDRGVIKANNRAADRLLARIKRVMIMGDFRYNQLLKVAERQNPVGLQRARQISAMDGLSIGYRNMES